MMNNPAMMQQASAIAQNMMQAPSGMQNTSGTPTQPVGTPMTPVTSMGMGMNPFQQMMMQQMMNPPAAATAAAQEPNQIAAMPEAVQRARFAPQLAQLAGMGFTDEPMCLRALVQHNGRLDAAIDVLLSGGSGE